MLSFTIETHNKNSADVMSTFCHFVRCCPESKAINCVASSSASAEGKHLCAHQTIGRSIDIIDCEGAR